MNPQISIIIPVYNVEPYIAKCIKSILNQTYTNFEALIIDDGSPDKSITIAKEIAGNDTRFLFLKKENGGLPSARNYGLDNASGDYIAFLDSDDYLSPLFFEKMLSILQISNADVSICDINMVDPDGKHLSAIYQRLTPYYTENDILLCNDTISAFAWNKMYKAEVFKGQRYDESVKTYEDSHFTFRTLYKKKLVLIQEPLYNYVQRPESITKSLPKTLIENKISIVESFYDFYHKNNIQQKDTYLHFCYLKTFVYSSSILIAKYSYHYSKDINRLLNITNKQIFTYNNIYKIKNYSKKIMLALLLLKFSPSLFKILIKLNSLKKQ